MSGRAPSRLEYDCRQDPHYDFDTWTIRRPGGAAPPVATVAEVPARAPGDPCAAHGCDDVVAAIRSTTRPMLAPFCARCRHRGIAAIGRGFTTEAEVTAYLRAERPFGTELRARPSRPTLKPGHEALHAAARRTGVPATTLTDRAWAAGLRVDRGGLPPARWDDLARGRAA